MSLKLKIQFIKRLLDSPSLKSLELDAADKSIDKLISDLFMTKRQDQGMRLTEQGYMLAFKAGINHYEFVINEHRNRLQLLMDVSRHITAPFFILKTHPLELHIFDEQIATAIVMQDGIENFIMSRKANQ